MSLNQNTSLDIYLLSDKITCTVGFCMLFSESSSGVSAMLPWQAGGDLRKSVRNLYARGILSRSK